MKHNIKIFNGSESAEITKFWNVIDINDEEAELTMYGDIVTKRPVDWWTGEPREGLYITPEGFLEDFEKIKNKNKVTVRISSSGGDLYTAIAICNRLSELKGDYMNKMKISVGNFIDFAFNALFRDDTL